MTTTRLTQEAREQLASLTVALAELGLTPNSARALLLAQDVADEANQARAEDLWPEDDDVVLGVLGCWQEDGREAWGDVLCEVPAFLTDRAEGDEPDDSDD